MVLQNAGSDADAATFPTTSSKAATTHALGSPEAIALPSTSTDASATLVPSVPEIRIPCGHIIPPFAFAATATALALV